VCALLATKDHVNLFLYDGAIVPDPEGIITPGTHKTRPNVSLSRRRHQRSRPDDDAAADHRQNRAGGWRKLKAS